ncbi:hypothetical protein EK21DRAFT_109215 [Setomelanomma holmii]|uniref:Uncharacterized protein n=1 Tax=Setomelanomma holmii TaxID=210430 RepID=A0A9P4HF20_9PLEO|nr:hypothetical protein EK21DRAFT_109215 [Setomelanomma holmii]
MSTTNIRRVEGSTPTTLRRATATLTTTSEDVPEPTSIEPQFSFIDLDTVAPTPSPTIDDSQTSATLSSVSSGPTCAADGDCASDKTCVKGRCTSPIDSAPLGGGSSLEPTSKLSTGAAVGVGLGVVAVILLLIGFSAWFWRRRGRRLAGNSIEALANNRHRSASNATDQKTLVASVPNSPQNAGFRGQHDQMPPEFFAKVTEANSILNNTGVGMEKYAHERQESSNTLSHQRSMSTDKSLPPPPTDMPLPPPPVEEKRYAINVNINKSMIFDDVMSAVAPLRDSDTDSTSTRERMPRYRFEEYLPPVATTPHLSISQKPASQRTSDYEMEQLPRRRGSSDTGSTSGNGDDDAETLSRKKTLKKLESKPPQLPMPDLPPPSPSFSFHSYTYDWYQDIIGTNEQVNGDDPTSRPVSRTPTPSLPERNPARAPTRATFGAALSSNPPDMDTSLIPPPLSSGGPNSPNKTSHLHPKTAAVRNSMAQPSPTATSFRLSPTVYTMPSRPPKVQPMRASLQSTTTQKTHMSRSWLPDDGLYLPEEGTHDSYTMFQKQRRLSDASRPTSYSPL